MDREAMLETWDEWWDGDIWVAPWGKALAGLTPEQAAWRPRREKAGRKGAKRGDDGAHSIWQNVNHVVFWRGNALRVLAGGKAATAEEVEELQFAPPREVTRAAWNKARRALKRSHEEVRAAIADEGTPMRRVNCWFAHDAYHLGQIMYTRGLMGLRPVM